MTPDPPVRVSAVLATYVFAFVAIVLTSIVAVMVLHSLDLDMPEIDAVTGLPGLLAGGLASSFALVFTLAITARTIPPARLRLMPGRERGADLGWMIVGVLALGQALDSLVTILGVQGRGSMETIRHALEGAAGQDLFAAVVVIGLIAGTSEELFFRSYMQSLLRERWSPSVAVMVTSACFGLLHLDPIHGPLAFILGLYLGFITELTGRALPALACHVINNVVFTVLTASVGSIAAFWPNVGLGAAATLVLVACLARLVTSFRTRQVVLAA